MGRREIDERILGEVGVGGGCLLALVVSGAIWGVLIWGVLWLLKGD